MTDQYQPQAQAYASTDIGLRNFMLGTYRYMIMAMAVSGVTAFFTGQYLMANPQIMAMLFNGVTLIALVIGIPIAFMAIGRKLPTMSLNGVRMFLFGFAAVMGVWLSTIGMFYSPIIIAKIFFMSVAMFAGLSLIGYTTKKDLSGIAKFCMMLFIGFVAVGVLGYFFPGLRPSGTMDIVINLVGLAAIAGITAWENQALKQIYYGVGGDSAMAEKWSAYGAASLLLAFINMFQILLSLFGRE